MIVGEPVKYINGILNAFDSKGINNNQGRYGLTTPCPIDYDR